jgi:predicted transcriptional regulator
MPTARIKPTSIRLSETTQAGLARLAKARRQSQSRIAEIAIARYLDSEESAARALSPADRLKALRAFLDTLPSGRSAEAIDAEITWLRGDA